MTAFKLVLVLMVMFIANLIAIRLKQETLYDQPKVIRNVLRVSGPFTVEGVQPAEELLDLDSPIGGAPEELETFSAEDEPANAEAYLEKMIRWGERWELPRDYVARLRTLSPRRE